MPRFRGNTTRSFRRSRRETRWLSLPVVRTTLASSSSAAIILVLTAAEKAERPFTIVRTRLIMHVLSDQVAASETYQVALGGAVVSDQAVGIGVTAVPTPQTDRLSDLWFLYEDVCAQVIIGATSTIQEPAGTQVRVDSRAMRKVEEGEDIIFTLENSSIGDGTITTVAGRMLVKLH